MTVIHYQDICTKLKSIIDLLQYPKFESRKLVAELTKEALNTVMSVKTDESYLELPKQKDETIKSLRGIINHEIKSLLNTKIYEPNHVKINAITTATDQIKTTLEEFLAVLYIAREIASIRQS